MNELINTKIFECDNDDLEYDFYESEVLTENVLKDVEEKFGIKLPETYIELMKAKNGGMISFQNNTYYFEYMNPHDGEHCRSSLNIFQLRGITLDKIGIGCTFEMIEEWEYPEDIVILLHEGHYCVCLDYRNYNGDNPPVSYIDLEVELDVIVADNFEELINNLTVDIDDDDEEYENDEEHIAYEEEVKIFNRNEFEGLFECDQDEIEIVDGIHYFLTSAGDSEWFIKQLKKAINSNHVFVVEETVHALIGILKKYKKTVFLHNVKKDIEEIAQVVYNSEEYDVNKYSIRLKSYIENYII